MSKNSNSIYQRTESFLTKAKIVHNDKYDYSLVDYVNGRTKVDIICPIHGIFSQLPQSHVHGNGCGACGGTKLLTNDDFINKAIIIHGLTYGYKNVKYINFRTKVLITCYKHGDFLQTPNSHLDGTGCARCVSLAPLYIKEFIERSNLIHNKIYDYSLVKYVKYDTKVPIICNKHGIFEQTPHSHLQGQKCPRCAGNCKHTTKSFIFLANNIHNNRYNYSLTKYISKRKKVIIICPIHGEFFQSPGDHLSGNGCQKCAKNSFSKIAIIWLDEIALDKNIFIQHALNKGEYRISNTRYHVDGYCKETNTIYEFYGDCFHGNPRLFKSETYCHPYDKTLTAGELYIKTINRENIIKNNGHNLVTIWEYDYKNNFN